MRKIYIISLFLFSFVEMFSQEMIDSKVEVNREFEGKLIEYIKSPLSTAVSDTLMRFDIKFDYSVFDRPYKELYEFVPMQSVQIDTEKELKYPLFYSKFFVGYPWVADADLYFQPNLGSNLSALIYYNHNSFWGKLSKESQSPYGDRMINKVGASSGFSWKTGELSLGIEYSNNYYSYSGFPSDLSILNPLTHSYFKDSLSRSFDLVKVNLGVSSSNPNPTSLYYNFSFSYNYLKDNPTVSFYSPPISFNENVVKLFAEVGATILSKHRVLLGLNSLTIAHRGNRSYTKSLFEMTPKYLFVYNRWKLDAGVTIAFSYLDNVSMQKIANIYPNITLHYEVIKEKFWAYLKLDGENDFYSKMSLLEKNPWVCDTVVKSTAIPFRAELGLKGMVNDRFTYSVFGSFSKINGLMSFVSEINTPFQYTTYNDNKLLTTGAQVLYRSRNFEGGADIKYNHYLEEVGVYMLPNIEMNFNVKYYYTRRFFSELTCYYRGRVYGNNGSTGKVRIPGFVDLGLNVSYLFSPSVSFFIEGRNLLNRKIQYSENYIEPGINIGAGVCLKF